MKETKTHINIRTMSEAMIFDEGEVRRIGILYD
jgi:hypothetical protein